ncbi:MAG: gliding motility-associated ABC transporter permease subunit GldF [Cyclobacteriaceae bacterium]|jgi:ABC-2 type transport system permease protein
MMTIFTKEFNDFLNSLIGYVAISVFLTGVGLIMWLFPDTNVLDYGYATLEPVFTVGPYLLLFLVAAITMKSFAEEKRSGTLELLYTLPFHTLDILLGKYLAALSLVMVALVPTLLYYVSIYQLGNPTGNLDASGILGSYLGVLLLSSVFIAIGMFCSALTENQIVSFVLSAFLSFLIYQGFEAIATIDVWGSWSYYLEQLGIMFHYENISRGVLDAKDFAYFIGTSFLFLLMTLLTLESKR